MPRHQAGERYVAPIGNDLFVVEFHGDEDMGDSDGKTFDKLPEDRGREIWLWDCLSGRALVETVIHEACHGAFPCLNEASVGRFASDVALLLEQMGEIDATHDSEEECEEECEEAGAIIRAGGMVGDGDGEQEKNQGP